jgi:protein-serine/threonine kinase
VRSVEVGPSSFDKIKLIGKGDVGKVYLVREKKSSRLYAMKGKLHWKSPATKSANMY